MNQKGETTLLAITLVAILSGVLVLGTLELERSFWKLRKRTQLILCAKEVKGELERHLIVMGRTNFAIRHIETARWIMVFIPGLQGVALSSDKLKKAIKVYQDGRLIYYLKKLADLRKNCKLDPRFYISPYEIGLNGHKRHWNGEAKRRKTRWNYYIASFPYMLEIEIDASKQERIRPKVHFVIKEKAEKLSSLLSSVY